MLNPLLDVRIIGVFHHAKLEWGWKLGLYEGQANTLLPELHPSLSSMPEF